MGQIHLDVDLFCSGCMTALTVEESAGHHILIEPCKNCTQNERQQTADDLRVEKHLDEKGTSVTGKEKLKEIEEENERREKSLENVRRMERGET